MGLALNDGVDIIFVEKSGRIPEPGSGRGHVTWLTYVMAHVSLPEPLP
jgi:hypothetical protein